MRPIRIAPVLAAGTLLFAACGGGSTNDAASSDAPTTLAAEAGELDTSAATGEAAPGDATSTAAAPEALQFNAPLVGGGEIDARTLAGKPTVFWFWAPT